MSSVPDKCEWHGIGLTPEGSGKVRPRVCVVHPGNQQSSFRTALGLYKQSLLTRFVTSIYYSEPMFRFFHFFRPSLGYLAKKVEGKLERRRTAALEGFVTQWPWPELAYLAFSQLGIGSSESWIRWRNEVFGRWASRHALDDVDVVWGSETSSLEIFQEAKQRGIRRVLLMTTAHVCESDRVLREQLALCPEHKEHIIHSLKTQEDINHRLREIDLADVVVVPSSFVRRSVERYGVPVDKISFNPFGVDINNFKPHDQSEVISPLIFLFVGWFRYLKGIYYLLEAWHKADLAKKAELWLVGGVRQQLLLWNGALPDGVRLLGPTAHSELRHIYQKAHVFVFPSLIEGLARVVLEAMASGLPIIGTDYLLEGLVENGVQGFLVGAGDVDRLAEKIRFLGDKPLVAAKMGVSARERAKDYTWTSYEKRCVEICKSLPHG